MLPQNEKKTHVELLRLCMILSNLSIVEQLLPARNEEENH